MKKPWLACSCVAAALAGLSGCAHYPVNAPKTADSRDGYYLRNHKRQNNSEEVFFLVSFSGGGTRAASFSYGLLEALRDTTYESGGQPRRLLDEIDVISSVSGGSFTSAAYALYGDRIFEVFEPAFLYHDVQSALVRKALNPLHWPALASGNFGISDLAAEYYDDILFNGATFSDLATNDTPYIVINITDVTTGNRLSYNQEVFDGIGSDVGSYPISRAVAASSAVPGMLSPMTLRNYAGQYPLTPPKWRQRTYDQPADDAVRVLERRMSLYDDSAKSPYIHVVDGCVSDNLGLRCYLDASAVLQANPDLLGAFSEKEKARKIVLVTVNSFVHPDKGFARTEEPPKSKEAKKESSDRTMERYSEDSLVDMRRLVRGLKADLEKNRKIDLYFIELDFLKVKDPTLARSLLSLPTTFRLQQDVVNGLKDTARTLLYDSPEFQRLAADLGASYPDQPAPAKKRRWWKIDD